MSNGVKIVMGFIIKNQANNWAYVLVVAGIAFLVGAWILLYAHQTIQEINSLSIPAEEIYH